MVFVNEIAEVVHGVVDYYSGAPNKNIGDAFLLVWKFEDEAVITDPYTGEPIVDKENPKVSSLAELAVFSFLKIPAALAKAPKLKKYRTNQGLLERLKTPEYRVKIGFGMHSGWAIEGAIGSKYKIDASYLSPNVNIASRLEAATKQYGVSLLISENVKDLVREPLKGMIRTVDRVKVKGGNDESFMQIGTIDIHIPEFFYSTREMAEERTGIEKKREKLRLKKERKQILDNLINNEMDIKMLLASDDEITQMRVNFFNEFYREWNTAVNNYLRGEWTKARDGMLKTRFMIKTNDLKQPETALEDGPSRALLQFMEEHGFESPHDWEHLRVLG